MNDPAPVEPVRTAVIVAAGKGSRLAQDHPWPKPLIPVAGVPLIARVMRNAARVGIRRFVVVIGFQAEVMRRKLPSLLPGGCELELVHNPRFEEPNGVSLLAAAEILKEPFALLMADHLFSPERLRETMDCFTEHRRSLLVVEGKEHFTGDMDDATLVAIRDGKVAAISKGLSPYDAVDTGMFILKPDEIATALSAAGKSPTISDGIRNLATAGHLDALKLTRGYWQDIDTVKDVQAAERKL